MKILTKSNLKNNKPALEVFAVVISLVSLFASGATIYFQYFHISETARIELSSFSFHVYEEQIGYEIEFALINQGNRQILMKSLGLEISFFDKNENSLGTMRYDIFNPVIVEPQKIKLRNHKSVSKWNPLYSDGPPPVSLHSLRGRDRLNAISPEKTKIKLIYNLLGGGGSMLIGDVTIATSRFTLEPMHYLAGLPQGFPEKSSDLFYQFFLDNKYDGHYYLLNKLKQKSITIQL